MSVARQSRCTGKPQASCDQGSVGPLSRGCCVHGNDAFRLHLFVIQPTIHSLSHRTIEPRINQIAPSLSGMTLGNLSHAREQVLVRGLGRHRPTRTRGRDLRWRGDCGTAASGNDSSQGYGLICTRPQLSNNDCSISSLLHHNAFGFTNGR